MRSVPDRATHRQPTAAGVDRRPNDGIVFCGAELVAYCERFRRAIFVTCLVIVGVASAAALALLPLRSYPTGSGPSIVAVAAAGLLVLAAPIAIRHAAWLHRALTLHPRLQFSGVLLAAALVAAVRPLNSQLWWPSCAILIALATLVPLWRALAYCLVVLTANLVAHLTANDLDTTAPVAIVGLWVGYPFWSVMFAVVTDRLAAQLMQLNLRPTVPQRPIRVTAWISGVPAGGGPPRAPEDAQPGQTARTNPLDRLTARQLEVAALLVDGLRYREVAACLSISERQVERHIANALNRLGIGNVNQLVATVVEAGLVPHQMQSAGESPGADDEDDASQLNTGALSAAVGSGVP
jgi:DNA-binding CsgD family transcriptional regulator